MRVRQKEIRKSRKREDTRIKAEIKQSKETKKAQVAPAKPRTRRAAPPAQSS